MSTELATSNGGSLAQDRREYPPCGDAAPSIESILANAVERGMEPAALEKIAALYERMMATRAEQSFNRALAAFKRECGPVAKSKEAFDKHGKTMYRYADLSQITVAVDPALQRNGLTYTWDTVVTGNVTATTCTLRHVDGAQHTSTFACPGAGSPMMNAPQIAASAATYGKRYSLIGVLGLVIDDDDDGRRATPNPQPDADPAAPRVLPRDERQQTANPDGIDQTPRVRKEQISALSARWRYHFPDAEHNAAGFAEWACGVTGASVDLTKFGNWTLDLVEICDQQLPPVNP